MRRKIFFLIPTATGGGAEKVVRHLLRHLDRDKFAPGLILFESSNLLHAGLPSDIHVEVLKSERRRFGPQYLIFMGLAALLKKEKPDALVSFMWYPNFVAIMGGLISRERCKIIAGEVSTLQSPLHEGRAMELLRKFIIRFFYPRADMITVNSSEMGLQLRKMFGFVHEKIATIYNPVDIDEEYLMSREEAGHPWIRERVPIIVAVGRLGEEKGYPYLLEAVRILASNHINCRLLICGRGEQEGKLRKNMMELGIEDRVEFLGYQENPYKYLAKAALFVLPSLFEGLPNALLEAMALGVPSIATRCPTGPEEIITDGVNGLLVPPADERALAEAMARVLSDEKLRKRLAEGGRKRAEAFSVKKIIKEYEMLIEEACAGSAVK